MIPVNRSQTNISGPVNTENSRWIKSENTSTYSYELERRAYVTQL